MTAFLVRRGLFGLLVLWIVSVAVFLLFFVTPHDPARTIAGRLATPQTVALVNHRLGLDRPLIDQYGSFAWRLLHGDLGYSYYNSEPVRALLFSRLPVTASLALGAAVLWLVVGIGVGVVAARRPRSLADRGGTLFVLTGLSMPTFLLGLLLIYFLFFKLHLAGIDLFPASGYVALTQDPAGWAQHLILPWITLAMVIAATYSRLTRSSLLEVLGEDYIRTARSKGLSERRVVYRHGLRSALTPVFTQFGIDIGTLLGGVIVTEQVFGLPGLGQLALQSVTNQDLPVIIGTVLLASFFIVVANVLVDLGYAMLDPRVRPS
ncbi:MAG TPA: ABC transporter permease [Actinomycetota bacterium]|jgi:peptide/nickel transport system permease protein|nr:ABC transporter permease [Actinomycetota bacterium]